MGIKDFFKTLAKMGFKPTNADLTEIEHDATVEIDLLGTPVFRNFLIRHITEKYDESSALATGIALGHYISSMFGGPNRTVRIHLDGAPSEEKSFAHEEDPPSARPTSRRCLASWSRWKRDPSKANRPARPPSTRLPSFSTKSSFFRRLTRLSSFVVWRKQGLWCVSADLSLTPALRDCRRLGLV